MFYKKIGKFIFSSAAILTLAACGNGGSDADQDTTTTGTDTAGSGTEQTGDQIVLRMAWWGSQARHDRTVEVIEMYEAQNPHVDIQYEFFDLDGYITKLNTLVASDSVWDIFQLGGNYPTYINNIEPLNE